MSDEQPARPLNGGSRPVPDPTVLTDQAIAKEAAARQTAHLDLQKLLAAELLDGAHQREAVREFSHLEMEHAREVSLIKFSAAERLATRESELNALALAAAFAAQKEASAKEAEYTRIASSKAESATADAITKLGELFNTQAQGQADKIDDLKDRVGRIESIAVGGLGQRTEDRAGMFGTNQGRSVQYALAGLIIGALGLLVVIATFLIVHG